MWQRFISRLAAHGPVTPLVPASILQILNSELILSGPVAADCSLQTSERRVEIRDLNRSDAVHGRSSHPARRSRGQNDRRAFARGRQPQVYACLEYPYAQSVEGLYYRQLAGASTSTLSSLSRRTCSSTFTP